MLGKKRGKRSQPQGKQATFIYAGTRGVGLESALSFYETAKRAGFRARLVLSKDNARRDFVQKIYPEAKFIEDLGADSLDVVELVMQFEEAFDLEIPDEDAEKIKTVKDAVEYIEKNAKAGK